MGRSWWRYVGPDLVDVPKQKAGMILLVRFSHWFINMFKAKNGKKRKTLIDPCYPDEIYTHDSWVEIPQCWRYPHEPTIDFRRHPLQHAALLVAVTLFTADLICLAHPVPGCSGTTVVIRMVRMESDGSLNMFFYAQGSITRYHQFYTGFCKCPILGILNITFKYLLEIKSLNIWVMFN